MNARKYSKENRDRLASMADELLGYERERHCNPYMTIATAKELRRTDLKFWHMSAPREQAEEDARRNLRAKLGRMIVTTCSGGRIWAWLATPATATSSKHSAVSPRSTSRRSGPSRRP